jgi:demethoxyubiquinone hydroxylase (CLK1/Coq7/Cat5 family)
MESWISFVIASILVTGLGLLAAYYRQKCQDNYNLVQAFKTIIEHRFYDDFRYLTTVEDKKKILKQLEVMRDDEIIHVFDHPKEFLTALKFYIKVMKNDIDMDEALIRANQMMIEMEK